MKEIQGLQWQSLNLTTVPELYQGLYIYCIFSLELQLHSANITFKDE